MTKEYYSIKCKDGVDRQVWDVEKMLSNELELEQTNMCCYYYYEFVRFCDVFEYVARAGKKNIYTKDEDIAKAKDNLKQIKDKEFWLFMIKKLCKITEIGEEIKKLID